ncbi:helix-turn-helix domain-containing protein [Polyangium sp. 6x1]|uniref:helix-turn-helix domain-containing protein n=1 Tax=Polyangium sp. 6x1 TaxID=3042689 RepID=UPI002482626F|nr:helix-turn-helix domain-containing protein [Polyangium sp. 6x1]MDI1444641.1 helix-turn-helix domain-containing protein [Polyangium sp. 6x1]
MDRLAFSWWLHALGKRVRDLRLALDLSQAAVAARAGISASHLSKVENGCANATVDTLHGLAVALGVALIDVLNIESGPRGVFIEATRGLPRVALARTRKRLESKIRPSRPGPRSHTRGRVRRGRALTLAPRA